MWKTRVAFALCVILGQFANAEENESPASLKIVTHNVWYGFTKKSEPRYSNWKRWMASQAPDVVSLQELNEYTSDKLSEDAKSWGHQYSALLKEDGFATGITSRYPISDVKRIREGMHHGLLRCRIQGIWFYVIHSHPSNFARRMEEAALLEADVKSLPEPHGQIVLAGDFNSFSPADRAQYDQDVQLVPFFKMLDQRDTNAKHLNEGKLDYGGVTAILAQNYVDLVAHFREDAEPFVGTFPASLVSDENHGTDRRLDYIFVSPELLPKVESAQILRDAATEGLSDHFPVSATLKLRKSSQPEPIFLSEPELLQEHGAGEGPAWHPELGLLTSGEGNINLRSKDGTTVVYRADAGSNGLMFDRQGRLVICEPVRRRVSRVEIDGSTLVLAESYEGKKFNQPNDLTMDSQDRIYFSDPRYGDREGMEILDSNGREIEGVYRIDTDGTVSRIITHEVDRPNGLVVTHDDQFLFVADNNNALGGPRKLWRFALLPDGSVNFATQKLIHDWKTTRGPDGMKLDAVGRLYVAAGLNKPNPPHETAAVPTAGVYVFSSSGQLLTFVPITRDETTNCGFGGGDLKTLFVTAGGSLWSLKTAVPGKPVWPKSTGF
jgi:gluconolactonase